MSNDRVTKLLLAVIVMLLGILAIRPALPIAAAAPDAACAAKAIVGASLQVSGTPEGIVAFDAESGAVIRVKTEGGIGGGLVGYLRKDANGAWQLVPKSAAAVGDAEPTQVIAAKTDLLSLVAALDLFKADTGRYPSTEEGLHALVVQPGGTENWKGPYMKPAVPKDPWGNPYVYHFPGQRDGSHAELMSFGPDKKEGGNDDLIGR